MTSRNLKDLISDVITGDWGDEPTETSFIRVIRTTNFTNEGRLDFSKEIVIRDIERKKYEKKRLINGDVIIEKSGGSPTQPVGRVVLFDLNEDGYVCNNFTSILRPKRDVDGRYLLYAMYYLHNIGKTLPYQNKTTGIINLKLEAYLAGESIYAPEYPKQKKISSILFQADNLIQKRKESIKKMELLIQSLFLEMFGDPEINPKSFKKVPLSKLGVIMTGNTPPRKDANNYGDHIEWIKSDNINTDFHYLTLAKEFLSEKGALIGRIAPANSILVTCIAGSKNCIGNVALTDRSVAFNQQINAITPNKSVDPFFLYAQFLLSKKTIQNASTNSMKGMVSKSNFEKVEFIIPDKTEQERYGKLFVKILEKQSTMYLQLAKLEENFQSLLHQAFTGQLQFRNEGELVCH